METLGSASATDPNSEALQAVYAKKIRKCMRRIKRNFARCHPLPESEAPVTPDLPQVDARMRRARTEGPVPAPDEEDTDTVPESVVSGDSDGL